MRMDDSRTERGGNGRAGNEEESSESETHFGGIWKAENRFKRVTEVVRTSELFGLLCKGVTESELLADDDDEKLWVNWSSLYLPTSLSFVAPLVCFPTSSP